MTYCANRAKSNTCMSYSEVQLIVHKLTIIYELLEQREESKVYFDYPES